MYLEIAPSEWAITKRRSTQNSIHSRIDVEQFGFIPQLDDLPPCMRYPGSIPHRFFDHPTSSSPDNDRASNDDHRDRE